MTMDYEYRVPQGSNIPKKVMDGDQKVHLYKAEPGVAVGQRMIEGVRVYYVVFERSRQPFMVPVPLDHVQLGKPYRSLEERLASFSSLNVMPQIDPIDLQNWRDRGTSLDRYVRTLWLAIRQQRSKLEDLGLTQGVSRRMFDHNYFTWSVDKICTPDGVDTIYIRAYTHLDGCHRDPENAGFYSGNSLKVQRRQRDHDWRIANTIAMF
ncbi:5e4a3e9e-09d8-4771-93a2-0eac702e888c [Thermothielavioides terrestris]|uniref:5e4a3e9e-09d8-4771-93a2-0eac702e888c n=1 Tax=Thermothielavioides terrestris TaxID=2587410 RepID=A0A3S5CX50_9PEZI|nr:5e4a3e9e-09d8-4771-93a2-0eac702e888c [Thermothielavioides terrestris]